MFSASGVSHEMRYTNTHDTYLRTLYRVGGGIVITVCIMCVSVCLSIRNLTQEIVYGYRPNLKLGSHCMARDDPLEAMNLVLIGFLMWISIFLALRFTTICSVSRRVIGRFSPNLVR